MTSRILVVEDDASIRLGLEDTLQAKGYRVTVATRGAAGLDLAERVRPDLIILDIMLPDMDGFEVCRRLKSAPDLAGTPIIMLSARGAELDRVRGLELGADDYVTKPFSLMELLARVAAVLRRQARQVGEPALLEFGDVRIDFARQTAFKAGREVELPARAFAILKVFARRPGEVVTRDVLLEEAWGYERNPNTRTVDNHLVKLRKALEDEPERPRYLVTVHGAGYRLLVERGGAEPETG
ncbi:MAG TPA: response regulator transcription factor [Kofleriaceae bacterium]|nr:response regulator transcription factor [Kofleriaceae bacterium]